MAFTAKIEGLETELPGLNVKEALEWLGGSLEMYLMFIFRFHDRYSSRLQELPGLLEKGELAEAHRFVHSVKSLAGNLGAGRLRDKSISLEADMERGRKVPSQKSVDQFLDELSRILSLLGEFLELQYLSDVHEKRLPEQGA